MTQDQLIHTDETGRDLTVASNRDGQSYWLYVSNAECSEGYGLTIPNHVADALLLAVSAGPGAVLRDVSALLDQVGREETNPDADRRFLYTREIRLKLGMLPPCGGTHPNLPGARCSLDEHLDPESWHVDTERRLTWRNPPGENFEVRGWEPGPETREEWKHRNYGQHYSTLANGGELPETERLTAADLVAWAEDRKNAQAEGTER